MVERAGVVAIPPSVFYHDPADGSGLVRFAFCKDDATLTEAVERLGKLPTADIRRVVWGIGCTLALGHACPRHILVAVAWPYASGSLHLGHLGGAYLPPDIFARYHRLAGNRVLMVSGSDAHGTPITVKADQESTTPREVVDRYHRNPWLLGVWGSRSTSSRPP